MLNNKNRGLEKYFDKNRELEKYFDKRKRAELLEKIVIEVNSWDLGLEQLELHDNDEWNIEWQFGSAYEFSQAVNEHYSFSDRYFMIDYKDDGKEIISFSMIEYYYDLLLFKEEFIVDKASEYQTYTIQELLKKYNENYNYKLLWL